MAASLDASITLNRIISLLTPTGHQIHLGGDDLPKPFPDTLYVLDVLPGTMQQRWAQRTINVQQIQVLCVATGRGTVRAMAEQVNQRLPATEFIITGTSWQNFNGTHYELPVTISAVQ